MELSESYRKRIQELAGIDEKSQFGQDEIHSFLKNTKRGEFIYYIKHGDNKIRRVYYSGFRNGYHWANPAGGNNPYQKDEVIFPSKEVEIIKIGTTPVESKADYKERISTLKQIEKEKKGQELNQKYRDAYRQSKLYPNID